MILEHTQYTIKDEEFDSEWLRNIKDNLQIEFKHYLEKEYI